MPPPPTLESSALATELALLKFNRRLRIMIIAVG